MIMEARLRIAFVVGAYPVISETFIYSQIAGLIARGHTVEVFADLPDASGPEQGMPPGADLPVRVHYSGRRPELSRMLRRPGQSERSKVDGNTPQPVPAWNRLKQIGQFHLIAARYMRLFQGRCQRFDVIHSHFGSNGLKALCMKRMGVLGGRLVTTFHANDLTAYVRNFGNRSYRPLFRAGDLFTPISDYARKILVRLGCPPERIVVHRMGVDCEQFHFAPRTLTGIRPIRLLSVGRLVEKKGIDYALRATGVLVSRGYEIEYHIVGDGPLRGRLEGLARELGIADRVTFHGALAHSDVKSAMYAADLFVLPSVTASNHDQEGIPVVLMEAMATGMPVVTTDHAGISELVENGSAGFLVGERDVDALVARLALLIDHPESWPERGWQGRSRVEREYDVNTLNARLVHLYHSLAASS